MSTLVKVKNTLNKIREVVSKRKKHVFSYSFYYVFSWVIDYPLLTLLSFKYGLTGAVIWVIFIFLIDVVSLFLYLRTGDDIFGIEEMKDFVTEVKEAQPDSLKNKIFKKIFTTHTKIPFFVRVIFLSLFFNPFLVVIFLRDKLHISRKLTVKDIRIFISSFLIGAGYWAGLNLGIVELIKVVLKQALSLWYN